MRIAPIMIVAVIAGACRGKQSVPPCEAVGARFVILATRVVDGLAPDDDLRRNLTVQLPAMRDALVDACKDTSWEASIRTCMFEAPDHVTFERCQRDLTAPQRERLERKP